MGKVLFFALLSSQIFHKELPEKEDETATGNSTQIFVFAKDPLRVCGFPTSKGIFGVKLDHGIRLNYDIKYFVGVSVFLHRPVVWR